MDIRGVALYRGVTMSQSLQDKPAPERQVRIKVRVPGGVLDAVKGRAKAQGIPYTRYIRLLMERDIAAK